MTLSILLSAYLSNLLLAKSTGGLDIRRFLFPDGAAIATSLACGISFLAFAECAVATICSTAQRQLVLRALSLEAVSPEPASPRDYPALVASRLTSYGHSGHRLWYQEGSRRLSKCSVQSTNDVVRKRYDKSSILTPELHHVRAGKAWSALSPTTTGAITTQHRASNYNQA